MENISYIIPSINRETLFRTINSIEIWPGDEVLVEFDLPKSGGWGNVQRNKVIERAQNPWLAFIDDDDCYVNGHREIMDKAIKENPNKPNLFRIQYPNGNTIWKEKKVIPGNISTQMILIPNDKSMFEPWVPKRNMADFIFVDNWKWSEIIWREEVICQMGHDDIEKL